MTAVTTCSTRAFSNWTTTRSSSASARACARFSRATSSRRGLVVAMSGGIDSSVCAALGVQGARARNACTASCCRSAIPRASAPRAANSSPSTSASSYEVFDIAPALEAIGCYRWRDEAIRRVFPEYGDGWKNKIVISGGLEGRINHFQLVVQTPAGETEAGAPGAAASTCRSSPRPTTSSASARPWSTSTPTA